MSGESLRDRDAVWRKLLELRCQREIVERWLQTVGIPEQLQEQLRFLLQAIEQELQTMETARCPEATPRMREAS